MRISRMDFQWFSSGEAGARAAKTAPRCGLCNPARSVHAQNLPLYGRCAIPPSRGGFCRLPAFQPKSAAWGGSVAHKWGDVLRLDHLVVFAQHLRQKDVVPDLAGQPKPPQRMCRTSALTKSTSPSAKRHSQPGCGKPALPSACKSIPLPDVSARGRPRHR